MKKNDYLQLAQMMETNPMKSESLISQLCHYKTNVLKKYAKWISEKTGESFTPHEALYGTNAIFSLILSTFTLGMPLPIRLLMLLWLGTSIYQCKHFGD